MKKFLFWCLLFCPLVFSDMANWVNKFAKRQNDIKLLQQHLYLLEKEYKLLKHECQQTTNYQQSYPDNLEKAWNLIALLKALQLTMYDFLLQEHGTRFMEHQEPIGVPISLLAKNTEAQNCTLVLKYGLYNEYTYKKFI